MKGHVRVMAQAGKGGAEAWLAAEAPQRVDNHLPCRPEPWVHGEREHIGGAAIVGGRRDGVAELPPQRQGDTPVPTAGMR